MSGIIYDASSETMQDIDHVGLSILVRLGRVYVSSP